MVSAVIQPFNSGLIIHGTMLYSYLYVVTKKSSDYKLYDPRSFRCMQGLWIEGGGTCQGIYNQISVNSD